jgi:hypothetical protein
MQNSEIQFSVHRIHHVHTHEIIFYKIFEIFLRVLNCLFAVSLFFPRAIFVVFTEILFRET